MNLNRALLIGNLTRDPEAKSLPSGTKVTTFGLATNRVWRDKSSGERKEETQFHNIVVFGAQAETVAQYLKKGQNVLVEGRIQTRSWDAPDGSKRYRTEIVAERVQFGPKSSGGGAPSAGGETVASKEELGTINYPTEEVNPDDIPF